VAVSQPTGKIIPLRQRADGETDEALLAAAGGGDVLALGVLFDRHHEAVARFVGRLAFSDPAELADLVQTTFVEVGRSARSFKGKSAVKTWIFGIAVNVARHHARGEVRRRAMLAEMTVLPAAPAGGPDEAAARRQLLRRLSAALAELPDELRETFVLCDLEDVRGVEAARVLGVREGTIWWRLHEARKRLRAAVERGGR
jgi:RNA polymerase sigma-70 factor (ECF subfamily)